MSTRHPYPRHINKHTTRYICICTSYNILYYCDTNVIYIYICLSIVLYFARLQHIIYLVVGNANRRHIYYPWMNWRRVTARYCCGWAMLSAAHCYHCNLTLSLSVYLSIYLALNACTLIHDMYIYLYICIANIQTIAGGNFGASFSI